MAKTEKKKIDKKLKEKCRIVTPTFRLAFPHIFKPHAIDDKGEPKYSINMLFKKGTDLARIKEAMKNAKIAAFGPDKSNWPEELESPVVDGDDPKHADTQGYPGHWVIKASTNQQSKPGVIDLEGEPILEAADVYPGCYARAQVFARKWEYMGKEGIQFILDNVQKLKDGEPFGGKQSAKKAFGALAVESDEDEEESDSSFL